MMRSGYVFAGFLLGLLGIAVVSAAPVDVLEFVPSADNSDGGLSLYQTLSDGGIPGALLLDDHDRITELWPGYAQALHSTAFGPAMLRFQPSGVGGTNKWLEIDPADGYNPPWSCSYGTASNYPDAQPDAQVSCGWNRNGETSYASMGWNMESACLAGTGCPGYLNQMEWYHQWSPPVISGLPGIRFFTANGRVVEPYNLDVAIVADRVGLGNGLGIDDATQIWLADGRTWISGRYGKQQIYLPSGSNPHEAIIFSVDGIARAALSDSSGLDPSGTRGLALTVPITVAAGDATLNIGVDSDNPGIRRRFGTVAAEWLSVREEGALGSCWPEGRMSNLASAPRNVPPTDGGVPITTPTETKVCQQGTVAAGGGFGARWTTLAAYDLWGEDTGLVVGSADGGVVTQSIGHQVCSVFNQPGAQSHHAFELTAIVTGTYQGQAAHTAIKMAGTQQNAGTPGGITLVYRTTSPGGLGTNFSIGFVAGTAGNCVQPTLSVTDAAVYRLKWTLTGQALP